MAHYIRYLSDKGDKIKYKVPFIYKIMLDEFIPFEIGYLGDDHLFINNTTSLDIIFDL